MSRALALCLAGLPVAFVLSACTDTGMAFPGKSRSTAPPLLPNPDLQTPPTPDPAAPIDETGTLETSEANADLPTVSDVAPAGSEPPAAAAPSDAEAMSDAEATSDAEAMSGETAEEGAPTDSNEPSSTSTPPLGELPSGEELNAPTPITPSSGCVPGNTEPPQGLASLMIRGLEADYLVTLPDGYDGSEPVPLIFGFHGRARSYLEFERVDATEIQSELGSRAIMVYPQAQGGEGWTNEEELAPSLEFFDALYPQMLANYCVDSSHIFAVGHSSGGFFSHILACRYGERLRGIGVVAGTLLQSDCTGYVAAVMIHGVRDSVVATSRGESARDFLRTRNGCTSDTLPGPDGPCVSYQGCEPGLPIAWCEHDEPTYDDTNHGWPSFASHTIANFFFSLP